VTFGRVLLLLAALPASRPLAAQDSVRLRLQPAPGTTVAYRVTMETWMSGPGVPEDTAPSMRARSRLTVGLIGPGGDNGALDFQTRTDSMEIASAMPGVTSSLPPVVPRTDTVRVSRLGIVMPSPWSSRRDSMMAALGGAGAFGKGGSGEITFFIFPDHALRVGSTWADTTTTNDSTGAGSMHGTIHTVNRLDRITRDGGAPA